MSKEEEYTTKFIEALTNYDTRTMEDIVLQYPDIVHSNYQSMNIILILAAHGENDILDFIINKQKISIKDIKPYVETPNKKLGELEKFGFGQSLGKWINNAEKSMLETRCKTLTILYGAIDMDTLDASGSNLLLTQIDKYNFVIVKHLIGLGVNLKQRVKAFRKTLSYREYAGEVYNVTTNQDGLTRLNKIITVIKDAELEEFRKNNQ